MTLQNESIRPKIANLGNMNAAMQHDSSLNYTQFLQSVIKNSATKNLLIAFNYQFNNIDLLLESLVHRSFLHEWQHLKMKSNETLEFLGDSILGAIVSTQLFKRHPNLLEGDLSKMRSALVNQQSLAGLARFVQLGPTLLLGKGEQYSGGSDKDAILSDAFEAVLGAIYLDSSFDRLQQSLDFMLQNFCRESGVEFWSIQCLENFDVKSKLQELTVSLYKILPEYRAQQLNDSCFKVDLYLGNSYLLSTTDSSKKRAEKYLAGTALNEKLYLRFPEENNVT